MLGRVLFAMMRGRAGRPSKNSSHAERDSFGIEIKRLESSGLKRSLCGGELAGRTAATPPTHPSTENRVAALERLAREIGVGGFSGARSTPSPSELWGHDASNGQPLSLGRRLAH